MAMFCYRCKAETMWGFSLGFKHFAILCRACYDRRFPKVQEAPAPKRFRAQILS